MQLISAWSFFTFQYGSTLMEEDVDPETGIPIFTFQYGSTLINHFNHFPAWCKHLYIPIWFYFNTQCATSCQNTTNFTFQYGSTLIENGSERGKTGECFTFQYGSTLIAASFAIICACRPLHSNMVLL